MKIFTTEFWQVNLPDNWQHEHDAGSEVVFDPEGFGELQLSTSVFDSPVSRDHLYELAAEHLDAAAEEEEVEFGDFSGISFEYETDDEFWQEWYLMSGNIMLFVTYACDLGEEENEIDIVEFILDSLKVIVTEDQG